MRAWDEMSDRERDAAVHKALCPKHNVTEGEEPYYCDGEHDRSAGCEWIPVPRYTTDAAAALSILAKVAEWPTDRQYMLGSLVYQTACDSKWECDFAYGDVATLLIAVAKNPGIIARAAYEALRASRAGEGRHE